MKAPPIPLAVEIEPDVFQGFDRVAADPALRAAGLELAHRRRAVRRYDLLVRAFAWWDDLRGGIGLSDSLVAAQAARPEPRRMSARELGKAASRELDRS